MKTVPMAQKEENKAEKKDWKQNNPTGNLTLMSKRISKNRREIKDLEEQSKTSFILREK
jgi:ATP-binding cassette subfamily F protein uup